MSQVSMDLPDEVKDGRKVSMISLGIMALTVTTMVIQIYEFNYRRKMRAAEKNVADHLSKVAENQRAIAQRLGMKLPQTV